MPDKGTYFIEIGNEVVSQNGSGLVGSNYICLAALKGDANASLGVNAQDLLATRPYAGNEAPGCIWAF